MALEFLRRTRIPVTLSLTLFVLFSLFSLTVSRACAEDTYLPQKEWEREIHCNGDPDDPFPYVLNRTHQDCFDEPLVGADVLFHLLDVILR
ncbi:MAG: hypothetical protein JW958_03805 [Candidatus Eisenbacteria bacterium]|nr:hypothetical protein [Candidatus Eisenbacteria bacterium]